MFAGMPGTGIGAIFFALACVGMAIFRRMRQCSAFTLLSAVWILGWMLTVYGSVAWSWDDASEYDMLLSFSPLILLAAVLTTATAAAYALRRRAKKVAA